VNATGAVENQARSHRKSSSRLIAHRDFLRLWFGQSISEFGSQITTLAMPLAAVLVLHASTFQVGLLTTSGFSAFLLVGLPAGAWVDRVRRKSVMIWSDAVRTLVLASIPIAYGLGVLTLAQLYAVTFIHGVATVFFDVAYMSFVPGLVGRDHVAEANAKLQATVSIAQVSGPSASGLLIGLLSAPVAFITDAASFVVSVVSLLAIREHEPAPERTEQTSLRAEIGEGLRFVVRQPILRMIAGCTATSNLFSSAIFAISVVFLVRQVHLDASTIGLLTSLGAIGGVVGALSCGFLRRWLGSARIIWVSITLTSPFGLLLPATSPGPGLICYAVGMFMISFGAVVYNVHQASFRQLLCPPRLLGRMNATVRFIVWGTLPLGGLLGGGLGEWLGNRNAMWVAAIGMALASVWVLASPLLRMRDTEAIPAEPQDVVSMSAATAAGSGESGPETERGPTGLAAPQHGVRVADPVTQQRPGLPGVDDFLDPEPLRGSHRVADGVELGPDLG
jgi:MFS family permease